ncbi:thioredoxin domain-containing protein-like [Daphnia carinata]|uniref:thioredoxin domain-containing protein-like n=1 Tax=Daphnia carinata TaxID=120202 RepID=UPI00257CE845|nr:thioredoxin domain-containing protein-like [Daphnia carinata]
MLTSCLFLFVFLSSFVTAVFGNLEQVNDTDLEKLIANEKFVIVLFRDEICKGCDELEAQLSSIREDLVDSLNAWVVKAVSSPLVANFTSGKDSGKPLVVYFRHSVPLHYDGPLNDEVILETFVQNKEAAVSHLNDDSFEHLTQAASGATTGDWFVMFYRDDSEPCVKFLAKWEYIASQLKGRINLAKVNIKDDGISTGSRFGVEQVPAFLFFRQGKIFNYDLPKLDSKAFQDFALGWYKNVPSKNVPSPKTPFDELVDRAVFMLKENPLILPGAGIALILILLAVGFNAWKSRKPEKPTKTKKSVKKSN